MERNIIKSICMHCGKTVSGIVKRWACPKCRKAEIDAFKNGPKCHHP